MKILSVLIGTLAAFPLMSSAAQYKLIKAPVTLADWQSDDFYEGSAPQGLKTDEVVLAKDMQAKVGDDAIAFVSGFLRIIPSEGSELTVDISADATLGCAYTANITSPARKTLGLLVKKGIGKLQLGSFRQFDAYDYDVNMRIEAGALGLVCINEDPGETMKNRPQAFKYGHVEVQENGTLALGNPNGLSWRWSVRNWLRSVSGSGVITNSPGVIEAENCFFQTEGSHAEPNVFSGKLTGVMRNYHSGYQHFTGTDSTVSGEFRVFLNQGLDRVGTIGAVKVGVDATEPSSLGKTDGIVLGEGGGRFLYLGEGETTAKTWYLAETTEYGTKAANVIDGGATGGLVLQGNLKANTSGKLQRLHLTGSNTVPCRIEGEVANGAQRVHVVKKGSGEWRFLNKTSDRSSIAGLTVEEGVLSFDSIAERGVACSLGQCADFFTDQFADLTSATTVPYCFRMGGADTEGTLKYIGSDLAWCTTRPMALAGDARLVNAGQKSGGGATRFFYSSGVSSVASGLHMLTLDGESDVESVLSDVADGTSGSVGIAKDGAGTWTLAGTNTFTGPIAVNNGKLILRGLAGKFSWFKWTIRERRQADAQGITGKTQGAGVQIGEFGLFDAANARVGVNLAFNDPKRLKVAEYAKMDTDKCIYDYDNVPYYELRDAGRELTNAFDGNAGTFWGIIIYDPTTVGAGKTKREIVPTPGDPTTWTPVVMRLDPGAKEVASYDLTSPGTGGGNSHKCGEGVLPKSWKLEGSVDGVNWYVVHDITDAPWPQDPGKSYPWLKGGQEAHGKDLSTHTGGWPINGSTNAVTVVYNNPVSVAAGATLEAEGLVRLGSLKVDAKNGAGTIRGFVLADEGTLEVEHLSDASTTTLPGTYDLADGELEKVENWDISADGKSKPGWSASVRNGQITINKPGLTVIIR